MQTGASWLRLAQHVQTEVHAAAHACAVRGWCARGFKRARAPPDPAFGICRGLPTLAARQERALQGSPSVHTAGLDWETCGDRGSHGLPGISWVTVPRGRGQSF